MIENTIVPENEENASPLYTDEGEGMVTNRRQEDDITHQDGAEKVNAELREKLLRALADAENARKHGAKARAVGREEGIAAAVREFIDVLDNLDRALAIHKAPSDECDQQDALEAGIAATRDLMSAGLHRLHVERIAPLHKKFDPELCEAVSKRMVAGFARDTVLEVVQPGYRIGTRLIRPARVIIAGEIEQLRDRCF